MILSLTDSRKKKLTKDGSVLKYLRSVGGGYKGCFAGGLVLVFSALFLAVLFIPVGLGAGGIVFAGLFGIPGICLIVFGLTAQKRKVQSYLSYYQKETGFDVDEIQQIDREIMAPTTVTVGYMSDRTRRREPEVGCFITDHHFIMPMLMGNSYIKRISDIVAVAYSEEIPGINGYKYGLLFLSRTDNSVGYNAELTKEACLETIQALSKRNPSIITHQKFLYEGKKYNLLDNWQDIVQLHREVCGEP